MKRRMLLIDDSETFRAAASALMGAGGFEVTTALDGANGLELAAGLDPDVIVVDVGLPDCDGFDLAAEFAARDYIGRVVLVSSRNWTGLHTRLSASHALGFLPKESFDPVTLNALLDANLNANNRAASNGNANTGNADTGNADTGRVS